MNEIDKLSRRERRMIAKQVKAVKSLRSRRKQVHLTRQQLCERTGLNDLLCRAIPMSDIERERLNLVSEIALDHIERWENLDAQMFANVVGVLVEGFIAARQINETEAMQSEIKTAAVRLRDIKRIWFSGGSCPTENVAFVRFVLSEIYDMRDAFNRSELLALMKHAKAHYFEEAERMLPEFTKWF